MKRDACAAWRIRDLCDSVEQRFAVTYSETGRLRMLKGLDLSRQKTRPVHPQTTPPPPQRRLRASFPRGGVAPPPPPARPAPRWVEEAAGGRQARPPPRSGPPPPLRGGRALCGR